MNMLEIAQNIDKSPENEDWIDLSEIAQEFDIHDFYDFQEQDRLKCFWIGRWYCTDSYVGYRMYFLDDEPVAFSEQVGRKYSQDFEWFSREAAEKVYAFIQSMITRDEIHIKICDLTEDVGESFRIGYTKQVLDWDTARYHGEPIKLIEKIKDDPVYHLDKKVKIQLPSSGEELVVDVSDLDFLFHVTGPEVTKDKAVDTISLSDKLQDATIRAAGPQPTICEGKEPIR